MKEARLPVEAAAPIPHHREVRALPEVPHTVLPAGALHPVVPPAAAVAAEALAVAAADAQVAVADNASNQDCL